MYSYLIAIGAIVLLMILWGVVQMLWMHSFPEYHTDVDALAVRNDCHGCDDSGNCKTKNPDTCKQDNVMVV